MDLLLETKAAGLLMTTTLQRLAGLGTLDRQTPIGVGGLNSSVYNQSQVWSTAGTTLTI